MTTAPSKPVRVLLQASDPYVRVRGASRGPEGERLNPTVTYVAKPASGGRVSLTGKGKKVGTFRSPLRLSSAKPMRLMGRAINGLSSGTYRGAFELRGGAGGGVTAVNALPIDDYIKGVIAAEMPSSWHPQALRAQAVTARTYALSTSKTSGGVFDQYPDTRSQVYRGVSRGDVGQQRRRGRHLAPDPDLRRQARGDLLLLHLRRQDRERRELVRGLLAQAVAQEQGRPLRHDLAQAPLALPLLALGAGLQAGRPGPLREDPRDPARAVAPDRARPRLRQQGHQGPDRPADPRPPGPVRHLGVLQHHLQLAGQARQGRPRRRARRSRSWPARSTPPRAAGGCWSSGASAASGRASRGCTPPPGAGTAPRSRPRASTACARAPWPAPPCASASPARPGGRRAAGCRTRSAATGR